MKMEIKKYLLLIIQTIICGMLIGLVIGVFQLCVFYLAKFSQFMYTNESILLVLVMVVIGIGLSFIHKLLMKYNPNIGSSSVAYIELGIRGKREIDWKKEIVLVFINSCISILVGFPLGSEGPSVVMGGKISKMTQDISKIEDNDSIAIGCGTGFGCAFLSPIAGICYILEESLHKFNPSLLFRSILMMFSAYFTSSLVNKHHPLTIINIEIPKVDEYYIFIILMVINAFIGVLFVKLIVFLKKKLEKLNNNSIVKNLSFILFGIIIILNVFLCQYMGSGLSIINNISNFNMIWLVLLILVLRFIITCLCGTGKFGGGLVIPIMTIGALIGELVFLICHNLFSLSSDIQNVIVLVSIVMLFGVVTKTPITSIALLYSVIGYSGNDHVHALIIIPIAILTIFGSVGISKLFKVDCIYEEFMKISEENVEKIS